MAYGVFRRRYQPKNRLRFRYAYPPESDIKIPLFMHSYRQWRQKGLMILKQSTTQILRIGPFLDSVDGVSPETGLTITQADMQLSKDGAAFAQKSSATSATHDTDGWYTTTLSTTDTNTVGELILQVAVAGALPVWEHWFVLEQAIYDSLFASSAAGFDANQRVNVGQWLSQAVTLSAGNLPDVNIDELKDSAQSATDLQDFADAGYDPGTNKVQGVVLVDTTTTNTDMRGTDNAALASVLGAAVGADISADIAAVQADTDDIQTRLPAALISGRIDADIGAISTDTTAANNLELQYDGTGITGDTFPATQAQVGQIANVGAAVNTSAESYTLTTGVQASGTFSETAPLDGTYHQHTDTAGAMELYYQFDVTGVGVPVSTKVTGRLSGTNDTLGVFAYNWAGASWDQVGTYVGQAGTTDVVRSYDLYTSHVGTGANLGKVRIRFYAAAGLTTADLYIDQILVSYSVVSQTVGYALGAIWVDTNGSNTNTEPYVDGTADNPVSTWAAALTLSTSTGIKKFSIANGSSVTLTANSDNYVMMGEEWSLALGGQSITSASIMGATVSGISAGANARFVDCKIGTVSLTACGMYRCALTDTITLLSVDTYLLDGCFSGIAGAGTPTVDFGAAIGNTALNMRHYSGGVEIQNMGTTGTDTMSLEGDGQLVINANCAGGTVTIRGHFTITDNAGGALTQSDNARYDITQINAQVVDGLSVDTYAEPGSVPAATASITDKLSWIYTISRNKATQTSTTKTIRNDGDAGDIATAAISDAAGTFTRDEYT